VINDDLNLNGIISDPLGDLVLNDWVDVQWGLQNSTANNSGNVFINDTLHANNNFEVKNNAAFGNYAVDATKAITTPTFYSEQAQIGAATGGLKGAGTLNSVQLCIQGDCRSSWGAVGSASGWTNAGYVLYVTDITERVAIGGTSSQVAQLTVTGGTYAEGIRIYSNSSYSPFVIRNSTDSGDLFRVDQTGNITSDGAMNLYVTGGDTVQIEDNVRITGELTVTGINNKIGGAASLVPLAVKTDINGLGIVVECGMTNCANRLNLKVRSEGYGTIDTYYNGSAATDLVLNPIPSTDYNGGNVGIGVTDPLHLLHIKTDHGNAQFDIQSGNSPYWAMYQDGGTYDLRFWNLGGDNRLILKTSGAVQIPIALGIGVTPSYPLHVKSGDFIDAVVQGALAVLDDAGTGNGTLCLGSDCKTGWGPNYSNVFKKDLGTPPDGLDYDCSRNAIGQLVTGYVMVGIENSATAKIICARMW
ncbi:MAG: hypothetical protein Q8L21_00285, partial [Candidatus Komeilibacteria bacterium]|nr:hypothetical protein [Candidatus Komeilibacteria bacterium]